MKSIQTKIVVFILVIIMLCSGVVGGIGMVHLRKMSDQNSAQIMNLSCREEEHRRLGAEVIRRDVCRDSHVLARLPIHRRMVVLRLSL